jgi:hypothetical protein
VTNVPPFRPECLTPAHLVSAVKASRTTDLDSAIRARVLALDRDASLYVLGVIRIGPREAVLVSQRPLGAEGNVCVCATVRDKGTH